LGEILKKTKPKELAKIKVLDPACGSGSFLNAAYDKILDTMTKQNPQTSLFAKIDILKENIFGVDLDAQAVEIAQLNLLLKVLSQKTKGINKSKKPQLIIQDDEDEDEDEYDENYLQKFDNEIIKNYVNEFHPECLNHNYEEIQKLAIVTKNSNGIIIDPLHRTIPYLTKYERARILGQRAKQIETGAKPLVNVPENIVDSYIIAELELREKRIPFIIRRPIPGGACEYWNLKDLEVIAF
jgi:DNA-directed RNA polymerase subunit K/omega